MVLGCEPPRELVQNELKLPLSMGKKNIEIPYENQGFQSSFGGGARRVAAETEPRVALSMGRKITEIP